MSYDDDALDDELQNWITPSRTQTSVLGSRDRLWVRDLRCLLLSRNLDLRLGNARVGEAQVLGRVRVALGWVFHWRLQFLREVRGKGKGRLRVLRGWRVLVGGAAWDRRPVLERGTPPNIRHSIILPLRIRNIVV